MGEASGMPTCRVREHDDTSQTEKTGTKKTTKKKEDTSETKRTTSGAKRSEKAARKLQCYSMNSTNCTYAGQN